MEVTQMSAEEIGRSLALEQYRQHMHILENARQKFKDARDNAEVYRQRLLTCCPEIRQIGYRHSED